MYNGLVCLADYYIFAREWTRPPAGESMLAQKWTCPHARPVCWPTAIMTGLRNVISKWQQ